MTYKSPHEGILQARGLMFFLYGEAVKAGRDGADVHVKEWSGSDKFEVLSPNGRQAGFHRVKDKITLSYAGFGYGAKPPDSLIDLLAGEAMPDAASRWMHTTVHHLTAD